MQTNAGYGWDNGQVNQCPYAYFSAGESQNPCTWCGEPFNTTAPGAARADACQVDYGYTRDAAAGVMPCLRGSYKDVLGASACSQVGRRSASNAGARRTMGSWQGGGM